MTSWQVMYGSGEADGSFEKRVEVGKKKGWMVAEKRRRDFVFKFPVGGLEICLMTE